MDKTIRKFASFDEMKDEEYRYWQSRPLHERLAAVTEMIEMAYALKGIKIERLPRDQWPVVKMQRRSDDT